MNSYFLKLIRFPNLAIIVFTQYFTAIFLVGPKSRWATYIFDYKLFILSLSTVFIAAGAYIFNDITDVKTDEINKPKKVFVGLSISRENALILFILFTSLGIIGGFILTPSIGIINIVATLLLWLYSILFKKQPLIGNISIGILASITLVIISIYYQKSIYLIGSYSLFAFMITLIREIIKDLEDIKGDTACENKTLPVLLGIKKTKWVLYSLIGLYSVVLISLTIRFNHSLYLFLSAILLLNIYLLRQLPKAYVQKDFSLLSNLCKLEMLIGILSMSVWK